MNVGCAGGVSTVHLQHMEDGSLAVRWREQALVACACACTGRIGRGEGGDGGR